MSTRPTPPDWWRERLAERGGVFSAAEATTAGMYNVLRTRRALGEWTDLDAPGLFLAGTDVQPRHRLWEALLHGGPGSTLSGVAALLEQGFPDWEHDLLDVVCPRGVTKLGGVRFHRGCRTELAGSLPPVAVVAEAAVDAVGWSRTDKEAAAVLRIVLQKRMATPEEIEARLGRNTKRAALIRQVVADARGGLTTATEALVAHAWEAAGHPRLRRQESFVDSDGVRRMVDLTAHPVEFAGLTHRMGFELLGLHHHDVVQATEDSRRTADALAQGFVLLGIPNGEAHADIDATVRRMAGICRRWGWTG